MNIAFLGPTQWELLDLIRRHPGCSTTELIFLASKEDVEIPEHRNSVLDALAFDPYYHYPSESDAT